MQLEEVSMGIAVALDVHRNQITYKLLNRDTGEARRGRVAPAARADMRAWLAQFVGCEAEFALESTTGWRFVVEEIERLGIGRIWPSGGAAKRGRKQRAKTNKPTATCSYGCRSRASCRSRGSRRRTSSSCVRGCGCA
jgi:transposase